MYLIFSSNPEANASGFEERPRYMFAGLTNYRVIERLNMLNITLCM